MVELRDFRRLSRNWEALAQDDPLFGILSDPTKAYGQWHADEFFASGRAHVEKLLRTLADARAPFANGACLDFGCGVGRLTVPLSSSFDRTVGVDVSKGMIAAARCYAPADGRCEFVVNRDPDLKRFADDTFDLVHSCLVLQHIPPEISVRYIGEFFRVAKPGGVVVFQLPAETRTEAEISAAHALPDAAFKARITIVDPPHALPAGTDAAIAVRVTNAGEVVWRRDLPAGRHICIGNHWLREDGTLVFRDDGRAMLPKDLMPGETVEVTLHVQAPADPRPYQLEIDLVQEHVSWFADKGSPTARVPIAITGTVATATASGQAPAAAERPAAPVAAPRRPTMWTRLTRRLRGGTPTFEMHVIPRAVVEETIAASGGRLLRAVDDNAAGARWLSYTYICRKR